MEYPVIFKRNKNNNPKEGSDMEASNVTFSDAVRNYKFDAAVEREQRALDLIKSKPNGSVIKRSEFLRAMQCDSSWMYQVLKKMEKRGLIAREKVSPRRTAYYYTDGVQVAKIPAKKRLAKTKYSLEERRKRILDYIDQKGQGSIITHAELMPVTGMTKNNIWRLLESMEQKHLLRRERVSPRKVAFYTVQPELTTTPVEPTVPEPPVVDIATPVSDPEPVAPIITPEPEPVKVSETDTESEIDVVHHVMGLIKDYYWETSSDSLHGLVEWLNLKNKEQENV